jgi:WD40 repeat protein
MKLLVFGKKAILFVAIEKTIYGIHINGSHTGVSIEYKFEGVEANASILSIETDEHENFLVAVWTNKIITCWNVNTGALLSNKTMRKKSGTLAVATWAKNEKESHIVAIVGDRAGDLWGFNIPELNKETLLGGHTASVITDIAYSSANNLILTSDRDEKIRYSSFPDVETIDGFSLGHTSVVSSITPVCKDYLASIGWDHKLMIWNFSDKQKCQETTLKSISTMNQGGGITPAITELSVNDSKTDDKEEEGQDEDEGADEKNYNESSFGHYPWKISCCCLAHNQQQHVHHHNGQDYDHAQYHNHKLFFLNVLFKEEKKFEVFTLDTSDAVTSSPALSTAASHEVNLPDVPMDILSFPTLLLSSCWDIVWMVLLPAPALLQVFGRRKTSDVGVSCATDGKCGTTVGGEIANITEEFFSEGILQYLKNHTSKMID